MYEADKRPRKIREQRVMRGPDPRVEVYWKSVMLPAIRDAVVKIGIEQFAKIVGRRRYVIANAVHERGTYFRAEDFMTLLAVSDEDTSVRLFNLFAFPLGYCAQTPKRAAEANAARERIKRIKDEVIATLGADEGRKFIDDFERECEVENARRKAAREANPWDVKTALASVN
jgi:hypothetical protein